MPSGRVIIGGATAYDDGWKVRAEGAPPGRMSSDAVAELTSEALRSRHGSTLATRMGMQQTFFAMFDSWSDASKAIRELEAMGTPREHLGIIVHRDALPAEEVHAGESQVRRGAVIGGVTVGLFGALLGGLFGGPLGLVGAGPVAAALFAGTLGGVYGTAMGAIAGASSVDSHLEKLSTELAGGKVLVTVEAPGPTSKEHAEAIVARGGGRVVERAL